MNIMMVNGQQAWKMCTKTKTNHLKLDNAKFQWGLAEKMLLFRDEFAVDFLDES